MGDMSKAALLPSSIVVETFPHNPTLDSGVKHKNARFTLAGLAVLVSAGIFLAYSSIPTLDSRGHSDIFRSALSTFESSVNSHQLCPGLYGKSTSHSGFIGLNGDGPNNPRKSFFWYFEAQNGDPEAPLILTIGGGPGTSGMLNPLIGQSHCMISANGTVPNPNAWSEHFNLLALDHPIGVGFSHGVRVNNSRDAAFDAYDFLQKFYVLFPHLANNPLVLASGSYGGTYVPHIATVIHEQNVAIIENRGLYLGAKHINLESMMVSNPYSDIMSHWRWALQQRCFYTDLFNATACDIMFERLPFCLEAIQVAYQDPTVEHRFDATRVCNRIELPVPPGRSYENVQQRCNGTFEDCVPQSVWAGKFLNDAEVKVRLGVPENLKFEALNEEVFQEFLHAGDLAQPAYLLYEPLLAAGIRLLHYVGKLDANCAWPGVISFLKFIRSPYQTAFITAPDLRWKDQNATVRVIGEGAGNMTYILMDYAGHMVTKDQPTLVKTILHHWIKNMPFEVETRITSS